MSCTLRREENINDLLDDILDGAGREEIRAHLVACPSCRTTRAELEKLALRARELPGTMAPSSDLWPDLRRRIEVEKRFAPRPLPHWGLAMAAGLLMAGVIIGSMMSRGLPGGDASPAAPSGSTYAAGTVAVANDLLAGLRAAEVDFQDATRALLDAIAANRVNLPSGAADTVEVNLDLIRAAIDQVWVALEADPDNSDNAHRLVDLYRTQIRMLEQTARVEQNLSGARRTAL